MIGIEGFDLKLGLEMIRIWDLELFYFGYLGLTAWIFEKGCLSAAGTCACGRSINAESMGAEAKNPKDISEGSNASSRHSVDDHKGERMRNGRADLPTPMEGRSPPRYSSSHTFVKALNKDCKQCQLSSISN